MRRLGLLLTVCLAAAAGCNIPSLGVYVGTATESVSGQLRADSGGVPGQTLDLNSDLGVSDRKAPIDARLVFAKGRGMFDVSYSRRSIDSTGTLAAPADFAGASLAAGAVGSSLALDEYRACLGLRTISANRKYIGSVRAGLLGADWSAALTDSDPETATAGQFTFLPVVGAAFEVDLGPFASFIVEGEGMSMEMSGTKARLAEWSAAIKIVMVQGSHLMLGFRSRELDVEEEGERLSLGLEGGTIAFQLGLQFSR